MAFDILCLFYSEFNTEKGAEIIYQLPVDYIKQEEFVKVSEFVIPRTELCDKLVSLKLGDAYLLGYPIYLCNQSYDRVKFQFNFCILLSQKEYESHYYLYDLLLKKIGKTFESIEIEGEFDFIRNNRNIIESFMVKLFKSIKEGDELISIHFKEGIEFHFLFKYSDFSQSKTQFDFYKVPIWIKQIDSKDIIYYDKIIKKIIEAIDGILTIHHIANKCELNIEFVKLIIHNLIIIKAISIVDLFQFNNIYRSTSKMRDVDKGELMREFSDFVQLNYKKNENQHREIVDVYSRSLDSIDKSLQDINDVTLYSYYCELTNALDVKDFVNKINLKGMDVSLLIAFGIYKKIIRRVHIYCLMVKNDLKEFRNSAFFSMMDGKHCFDEIRLQNNMTFDKAIDIINDTKKAHKEDNFYLIYK